MTKEINSLVLAYLGDTIYEDYIREYLIKKGKELKNKNITAVCTLVYYDGKKIIRATGKWHGTITEKEYPGNGFGFDSVFRLRDGRVSSISILILT